MHEHVETVDIPEDEWLVVFRCCSRAAAGAVLRTMGIPDGDQVRGWDVTSAGTPFAEVVVHRAASDSDRQFVGFLLLPHSHEPGRPVPEPRGWSEGRQPGV